MSASPSPAMTPTDRAGGPPTRAAALAVAAAGVLDVVAVLVFVVIGRRSHEDDEGLGGIAEIAAPFLIALVLGWAVMRLWRSPLWGTRAVGMWAITVAAGMLLRRFVFDRGTALTFIILTTVVFAVFLLGWRLVATQVVPRRDT